MAVFTINGVKKTFVNGDVEEDVLKGINLSLQEGDVTALKATLRLKERI